jgi:hypothetical protein
LLLSLYHLSKGDPSNCPDLEIVVDTSGKTETRALVSLLNWNGEVISETPKEIVARLHEDDDAWMLAQVHGTYEEEEEAMRLHGLATPCVEFSMVAGGEYVVMELETKEGELIRSEALPGDYRDASEFVNGNQPYLNLLQEYLENRIYGLT